MSAVTIRAARRADMPRIWELLHGLAEYERMQEIVTGTREALEAHLFREPPLVECLLAEREGALVGYALFYPTYSSFRTSGLMWLEDLFVEPAARGSGAGRALLAAVGGRALERGCQRLDWNVLDWNQPSIEFYERMGAKRTHADWYQYSLDVAGMRALAER